MPGEPVSEEDARLFGEALEMALEFWLEETGRDELPDELARKALTTMLEPEKDELHLAIVSEIDGQAVLTVAGKKESARMVIPEDKALAFRDTAREVVLVYDEDAIKPQDGNVLIGDGGEPTVEDLAARELHRLRTAARMMVVLGESEGLQAAMLTLCTDAGVVTYPYVHPELDSRRLSLAMLGQILWHYDESTPSGSHPLEIADHALLLTGQYDGDKHVGWSTEKSVEGQPWEPGG